MITSNNYYDKPTKLVAPPNCYVSSTSDTVFYSYQRSYCNLLLSKMMYWIFLYEVSIRDNQPVTILHKVV